MVITQIIYLIIVISLIILFFISFSRYISRIRQNSIHHKNEAIKNGAKLDTIIEQNSTIISLLEKQNKNS